MARIFIILHLLMSILPVSGQKMMDKQINDNLRKHVLFLTSVKPARNYQNITVLNEVADYIFKELLKYTKRVRYQTFNVQGKEYKNVIADFGPETGPVIVAGAHYDVCGNQQGADDNASAVAGLLELGRFLTDKKLTTRIQLVAFTLEEPPFFAGSDMGSAHHVKELLKEGVEIKAMICLEMIGYFSEEPGSQQFPDERLKKLYPDKGNFIIVVGASGQEAFTEKVKSLMKEDCKTDVQSINLPPDNPLAGLSDHRNYWKHGIKAVMINDTSFLRNPNYHKKSDTPETLDFEKMTEVVKGINHTLVHL